jgi:hypothetical protein
VLDSESCLEADAPRPQAQGCVSELERREHLVSFPPRIATANGIGTSGPEAYSAVSRSSERARRGCRPRYRLLVSVLSSLPLAPPADPLLLLAGTYYAVQKAMGLGSKAPESNAFLFGLMDKLELVASPSLNLTCWMLTSCTLVPR